MYMNKDSFLKTMVCLKTILYCLKLKWEKN